MGTDPQAALFHRSGILQGIFTDVRCTGKPREKYAKVLTLKCRPFLVSSTLPLLHRQDLFVQDFPKSLNKAGFLLQAASAGPARLSINVSWFYVSQLLLSDLLGAGGFQDLSKKAEPFS